MEKNEWIFFKDIDSSSAIDFWPYYYIGLLTVYYTSCYGEVERRTSVTRLERLQYVEVRTP